LGYAYPRVFWYHRLCGARLDAVTTVRNPYYSMQKQWPLMHILADERGWYALQQALPLTTIPCHPGKPTVRGQFRVGLVGRCTRAHVQFINSVRSSLPLSNILLTNRINRQFMTSLLLSPTSRYHHPSRCSQNGQRRDEWFGTSSSRTKANHPPATNTQKKPIRRHKRLAMRETQR